MEPTQQPQQTPLKNYKLTAEDLADRLGYSIQHVRVLAMTGKLPCIKRFRAYLFNEQEVYDFLKKQQQSSVAEKIDGTDSSRNTSTGETPTS